MDSTDPKTAGVSHEEELANLLSEIDISKIDVPPPLVGFLVVSLSDPVKQTDGMNPYMTYKVNTTTDRAEFQNTNPTVIRRYSDFTWLHQQLVDDFPGAIIPPLPKKNLADRFRDEFIRARMRTLEEFLNRVAAHAELGVSKCFLMFLQTESAEFTKIKESSLSASQSRAAMAKAGILSYVSDAYNKAKAAFTSNQDVAKSPADVRFEEIAQYVQALEVNMENVAKHTAVLVRKGQELASSLNEFGLAFTMLAETEAGQLGGLLNSVGATTDAISRLIAEEAEKESDNFEAPLLAYIGLVRAVRTALQAREEKKAGFLHAIEDLETKRAAYGRVKGLPGREVEAAGSAYMVQVAIDNAKAKKAVYEQTNARVIREVERFKVEHADEIKKITLDFIQMQVDHQTQILQRYKALTSNNATLNPAPPQASSQNENIYPPTVHIGLLQGNAKGSTDEKRDESVAV